MSIVNILCIGYGAAFLPFINCTDFDELRVVSHEIHDICQKGVKHVTFYGMQIPNTPGLFYDLFYGRYDSLELRMIADEDFRISSVYQSLTQPFNPNNKVMGKGDMKIISKWNGMVLMELAYLLRDQRAIELLGAYKRNICHKIMSFSSTYDFMAIRLTEKYSEESIKKQLMDLRPPYAK